MSEHAERAARALGLPVTTDAEDIERAVRRANELGLTPSAVRVVWQNHLLTDILQDLIAELRYMFADYESNADAFLVKGSCDRAEARLREASGDETVS